MSIHSKASIKPLQEKRTKSVSIQSQGEKPSENSSRIRQRFNDQLFGAFPLIKKDPKELLNDKLKQIRNVQQADPTDLDKAKLATNMGALKRFIDDMETKMVEEKRIAQQERLQITQYDQLVQNNNHRMKIARQTLENQQLEQIIAKRDKSQRLRRAELA